MCLQLFISYVYHFLQKADDGRLFLFQVSMRVGARLYFCLYTVTSRSLLIKLLALMWTSGIISSEIATTWDFTMNLTTSTLIYALLVLPC